MVKKPQARENRGFQKLKRLPEDGRPTIDPEDLRTARFAMRMNPDLMDEIARKARQLGFNRSNYVERVLIREMNEQAGFPMFDAVGRRTDIPEPKPGDGERGRAYFEQLAKGLRPIVDTGKKR